MRNKYYKMNALKPKSLGKVDNTGLGMVAHILTVGGRERRIRHSRPATAA